MATNPYESPAAKAAVVGSSERLPHELWLYAPAVYFAATGVIYTMLCVLAPLGIPMVFVGVALLRAGQGVSQFNRSVVAGSPDHLSALIATAQTVRAMRIYGLFMAVILAVYAMFFGAVFLFAFVAGGQ